MIKFPCRCHHQFVVEDDLAGSQIQCPRCGLLNDVPTLQDLQGMSDDGTILLDTDPVREEPGRYQKLKRAFAGEKTDDDGNPIDLRQKPEDFAHVGEPISLEDGPAKKAAPRYDPVTGELIRAFDVQKHPDDVENPAAIPMARATLNYAAKKGDDAGLGFSLIELLKPINLAAMLFVFLAHLFVFFIVFSVAMGALFVVPMWFALTMALFAHYANVVEEIGPGDNDELPRFMRQFSFGEDIWKPFVCSALAFFYSFGAPIATILFLPVPVKFRALISFGLMIVGALIFPAAYLTSITSGTVLNLRPDRVLAVMGKIGARYIFMVFLLVIGSIIYGTGMYMTSAGAMNFLNMLFGILPNLPGGILAGLGCVAAGVYLIHAFSWELGMAYRRYHEEFPWVFQYHVRVNNRAPGARPFAKPKIERPPAALRKIER